MTEEGRPEEVRRIAERAIRRLGILEWVLLVAAAAFALVAGAVTAFLVADLTGAPFRPTWAVASVLLFVVPALVVWVREGREEREPSADGRG